MYMFAKKVFFSVSCALASAAVNASDVLYSFDPDSSCGDFEEASRLDAENISNEARQYLTQRHNDAMSEYFRASVGVYGPDTDAVLYQAAAH
jgi:hypothetical protein